MCLCMCGVCPSVLSSSFRGPPGRTWTLLKRYSAWETVPGSCSGQSALVLEDRRCKSLPVRAGLRHLCSGSHSPRQSLAALSQWQSTCELWALSHTQTVWEVGGLGRALSSRGSALEGKTRQKHTGQFSDREFDNGPELVAVEENAKRLLMGITKHQYCKGTGWAVLRLCTQMCFRVLVESVPPSLLAIPSESGPLSTSGAGKCRRACKTSCFCVSTPTPDFVCFGGLRTHLFSPLKWSTSLGLLLMGGNPDFLFEEPPSWGLEGRVGGLGQTRFPVRADGPEVAHLAPFSRIGVDRVRPGATLTLPVRPCSVWDSAQSLLSLIDLCFPTTLWGGGSVPVSKALVLFF